MVAVPSAIGHRNVDGNDDRRRRVRTLDGEDEPEKEEDGKEVREHRGLTLARLWRRRGRGSLESAAKAADVRGEGELGGDGSRLPGPIPLARR